MAPRTGGAIYAFTKYTNSRFPLWPAITSYTSVSAYQCAKYCKAGSMSFNKPVLPHNSWMTTATCWSFNYNNDDSSCELYMYSASGGGSSGSGWTLTTDDSNYDYYELTTTWTSKAAGLINEAGATIFKAVPANVTLAVNVTNEGIISVTTGRLTLSGGGSFFNTANLQVSSGATLEIATTAFDLGATFTASSSFGKRMHQHDFIRPPGQEVMTCASYRLVV